MKFEEIEYESVITSHIKIFMYLAAKYVTSIIGYETEDLVQEQVLECYKNLDKCTNGDKVAGYIYKICENRLKGIYRDQIRQKRRPKYLGYLEEFNERGDTLALSEKWTPIEDSVYVAQSYERAEQIARQILSPFELYIYQNYLIGNKDIVEIELECGKNRKQIQNAVTRTRKKLSQKRDFILNEIWYN